MFKKKKKAVNSIALRKQTRLTEKTPFSVREAYKIIRTNIMFSTTGKGCKKIAITSSYPGEGKTTTCVNLALSFAQMDKRVLIIDCDMRKPQVHNTLEIDNLVGLSNVLGGFVKLKQAIHYLEDENISVIPSGHIPPNPAELIASEAMNEMLDELSQYFDYILIDTPPVNVVADAVILSKDISGLIMVTRQGKCTHKDLQQSLNKLKIAQAKVLGLVLTGEKRKNGKYGKYEGYEAYE